MAMACSHRVGLLPLFLRLWPWVSVSGSPASGSLRCLGSRKRVIETLLGSLLTSQCPVAGAGSSSSRGVMWKPGLILRRQYMNNRTRPKATMTRMMPSCAASLKQSQPELPGNNVSNIHQERAFRGDPRCFWNHSERSAPRGLDCRGQNIPIVELSAVKAVPRREAGVVSNRRHRNKSCVPVDN